MKRSKSWAALLGGMLVLLVVGLTTAIMGASSVGPWPVVAGPLAGSGSFSVTTSGSFYLSSGTTTATSVPCSWVMLSVSTSTAKLSTTGTAALSIPSGLAPVTIWTNNLNSLQVSGTNAVIGYIYGS